jgi:hypothetical protein
LDQEAARARTAKDRVGGGAWKLYMLYNQVSQFPKGDEAAETDWTYRQTLLQHWGTTIPSSITARVALAEFYHAYAWRARGGGYADTVSAEAWKVFQSRATQAYSTLVEAAKLPDTCPHWFFVMLEVARDLDWSKEQTQQLFDRAVAFDPSYYHSYREYALQHLPKWGGEPGEAEAFAEESYRQIGGRQGAFVYFEIATVIYCLCNEMPPQPTLSWPRLQGGFAEVEERYGATLLKLNRYAMLAYLYHDQDVARRILSRIGDRWEPAVWVTRASFEQARSWAALSNP